MTSIDRDSAITLMGWKRKVFDLYRRVRENDDPEKAWTEWRDERDELFRNHPQSPLPDERREEFTGLDYFDYDPEMRFVAGVSRTEPEIYSIATSGNSSFDFTRIGMVEIATQGHDVGLELYWLEGYGGGLFLPFRDESSGSQTYGGGRYLLDTVKGADLGMKGDELVLDFNFSYNPSCAYDPRWVCPLSPPPNRIDVPIQAGERFTGDGT